jgi:hypothetical protein
LFLKDGYLTLEGIIELELPITGFAYFLACQMTTREETPSDEAACNIPVLSAAVSQEEVICCLIEYLKVAFALR